MLLNNFKMKFKFFLHLIFMNASSKKLQASLPCPRLFASKILLKSPFPSCWVPPMPLPSEQTLGCSMWGLRTHSTFPDVRSECAALTVGSSILSAVQGHFEKAAGRSSGSICLFSFPSLASRINWEVRLWDYLGMSICAVNRDAFLCFLYVQILKNSWSAPFSESGY